MNEQIKEKSQYCLNCVTKPCQKGCPLENDIPEFIKCIKENDIEKAYQTLSKTTVLQPICGLICPHQSQCQGSCVRKFKGNPTSIGELEAYVGKEALKSNYSYSKKETKIKDINCSENCSSNRKQNNSLLKDDTYNKKVAIVGGGPAGLTCAAFLAREGIQVTIYEKHKELGGILSHGIPEFRLNREILKGTIKKIIDLGIDVKYNMILGENISIEKLEKEYDAVFLAFGANISSKMQIEGEELQGVYGGNELLEYNLHPEYKGKTVAIIGGGNVAMDCARTIKNKGAKNVYVIYRRAKEQMPAEKKEIEDAKKEGIEFLFQNNIVKILPEEKNNIGLNSNLDGKSVNKIECIKTKLVKKEGETREIPVDIEGSNYFMNIDYVVMCIGSKPEKNILDKLDLELDPKGYIKVDENYRTSNKKVYAGGDISGTKATVAWAARTGRKAAEAIICKLKVIK